MVLMCPELRLMFIHAPKTGGSSITAALRPWIRAGNPAYCEKMEVDDHGWQPPWHLFVSMHADYIAARPKIEQRRKNGIRLAGCVRDPFDLVKSLWHHFSGRKIPMADFLRKAITNPNGLRACGIYFQKKGGDPFCQMLGPADFILRFENLESDFSALCEDLEIEAELPHANRRATPAPIEHTKESIQIVLNQFGKDIERWNYPIPQEPTT